MSCSCDTPLAAVEEFFSGDETFGEEISVKRSWIVTGAGTHVIAREYVNTVAPIFMDFMWRIGSNTELLAPCTYRVTVDYAARPGDAPILEVDSTGASITVLQALSETKYGRSGFPTPPSFLGLVNVHENGIDGAEIVIPRLMWRVTHRIAYANFTEAYVNALTDLTGKTNVASWSGRAAGEVLYMGLVGVSRDDLNIDATHEFSISPNIGPVTIGPFTNVYKGGHEYLWIKHIEYSVPEFDTVIPVQIGLYVNKMYYDGDFSVLGFELWS